MASQIFAYRLHRNVRTAVSECTLNTHQAHVAYIYEQHRQHRTALICGTPAAQCPDVSRHYVIQAMNIERYDVKINLILCRPNG